MDGTERDADVERRARIRGLVPARAYRWNFAAMGLDYSLFLFGLSFASAYGVLPLFIHHLTPSNLALGLIPAIRALGLQLPPLLVSGYTERLARKKPFLLITSVVERVPYILLAVVTLLFATSRPGTLLWLVFALIGFSTLFGGMNYPAWLDLLARMLPSDWRGRFFGLSAAFGGLLGIAGGAIAVALLHGLPWPINFALCFACAFGALCVGFIFLAFAREPLLVVLPSRAPVAIERTWRRAPAVIRSNSNFRRFLYASALVSMASMATALYAVDAKRSLRLSDAAASLYPVVLLAASMVGNVLWGFVGDHRGQKHALSGGAWCTGLAALVALVARGSPLGLAGYAVVFALAGLGTSAIQLAGNTVAMEFAPAEQRPTYVGLALTWGAPFAFGAPLLGGLIADRAGYPPVFLLTTALAFGAALVVILGFATPSQHPSESALTDNYV